MEDADSCRGTRGRPTRLGKRGAPRRGTSESGDARPGSPGKLRPQARPSPEQAKTPCDPCWPMCPHLLLQPAEGLCAFSLQLVDALHQRLYRGIFLRSGEHGGGLKPAPQRMRHPPRPRPAWSWAHPGPRRLLELWGSCGCLRFGRGVDRGLSGSLGGDHDCAAPAPPGSWLLRCSRRPLQSRRSLHPSVWTANPET